MSDLRKLLVRAAGASSGVRILHVALAIEAERMRLAFRENMSCCVWGPAPPLPRERVSVPRRLRRFFGRYVVVTKGTGRRRKRLPKHNRHAPPEATW